ncbi:hypothetical protein GUJ93_ZPchr0006g40678 [Zizania palustris]|uniref:Uncharacterized protein n=1 Tax=Zizania palustris TaxID=103762 RepID=A0A8J5VLA1_ZIZPA|nr:hypothetical protein GUJ93_ZPchr0006g40678 [Zizania palustris]
MTPTASTSAGDPRGFRLRRLASAAPRWLHCRPCLWLHNAPASVRMHRLCPPLCPVVGARLPLPQSGLRRSLLRLASTAAGTALATPCHSGYATHCAPSSPPTSLHPLC